MAATRQILGTQLAITPKVDTKPYRAMGQKYSSVVELNKEWTEAKMSGEVLYSEIHLWLASMFGGVSPTQNGAAADLGYTWDYLPSTSAEDVPKTFTIESGDAVRAEKFGYGLVTDLGISWDRKEVKQTGSMIGQRFTDGISLTAVVDDQWTITTTGTPTGGTFTLTAAVNGSTQTTAAIVYNATPAQVLTALGALTNLNTSNITCTGGPLPTGVVVTFAGQLAGETVTLTHTDSLTGGSTPAVALAHTTTGSGPNPVSIVPVLPSTIDVFLDVTAAGLGGTQLSRVFAGEWSVTGKFKPIWRLNSTDASFVAHVEDAPKATGKLSVEADSQGMGLLTNMRAGTTVFIRILATGPQIDATPFNYKLQVDMAAQVSSISELKDYDGVAGIEFSYEILADNSYGRAMEIKVQNAIGSY